MQKPSRPYESPRLSAYRMSLHTRLRPNEANVAAKIIDGEAIIINISTGVYYSMDEAGATVWSLLQAGCSNRQVVERLAELYGVPADEVRQDVERLASEMLAERLVWVTCEPPADAPPPIGAKPEAPYSPPRLNVYRDMEDLLALDPPMPDAADAAEAYEAPADRHMGDVEWRKPD
jgi:hypothetical protein